MVAWIICLLSGGAPCGLQSRTTNFKESVLFVCSRLDSSSFSRLFAWLSPVKIASCKLWLRSEILDHSAASEEGGRACDFWPA